MTKTFIAPLPEWGLIHASGADAATFLHGQLTNDLLHLAAGAAQWNGYCTAKGRMLASFLVWRDGADGFFLATDIALAPALTKRLRMFVLRAKVVIEDVSEAFACFGMGREVESEVARGVEGATASVTAPALTPAPALMPTLTAAAHGNAWQLALSAIEGESSRTSTSRKLAFVPQADASAFVTTTALPAGDASDWTRLMIQAGEAWVTPATQEAFVPQMINFDAIGGINFKKGCYPGQEIVARAHYRGAVKRRMYRAEVDALAKAGDPLFGSAVDGQECGVIALAAPASAVVSTSASTADSAAVSAITGATGGTTSAVLAVVQMQSQAEGEVRLGSADGPLLRFAALPYAFPQPL